MTKKPDTPKKQKTPKPIRVLDERDQVWSSIKDLTVGMTPDQRYQTLKQFVDSILAARKTEGRDK
jgi:hypothetical protein